MRRKLTAAVLLAFALTAVSAVTFEVPREGASLAEAQDPPLVRSTPVATYEYDVLPGLQPGLVTGPASSFTPHVLTETCGWHRRRLRD